MARRRTGGKPGNQGKGVRRPITVRVPVPHKARYEAEARQLGLPVSDYLALLLARAHGLDTPAHLVPQQNQELPTGP